MLKFINVSKSFYENVVFEKLNFEIFKGSLVGLLGANGSGKTTLLKSIMNKINFTGEIKINGISNSDFINNTQNEISYIPDSPFNYEFLTGIEFIKFTMDLQKIRFKDVEEKVKMLIEMLNMQTHINKLILEYSHGMKQKISLISVLVQSPKILLLDEPTAGLDQTSIYVLKKLLKSLTEKGTTIIFSTHNLDLVANNCDSIIILNNKNISMINKIFKLNKNEIENIYFSLIDKNISLSLSNFTKIK